MLSLTPFLLTVTSLSGGVTILAQKDKKTGPERVNEPPRVI